MSTIYKRENGRYYISYNDDAGKRHRAPLIPPGHKYATKIKAVALKLKKTFDLQLNQLDDNISLESLVEEFQAANAMQGSLRQARRNTGHINRFLVERSIKNINQITKAELVAWLSEKKLAVSTLKCHQGAIIQFWKYLHDRELLGPAPTVKLAKREKLPPRHFSDEERKNLLELAKEHDCYLEVFIPLYTGVRLNELRLMEWKDFDWKRRLLIIPKTKSKCPRSVPLSPKIIEEVKPLSGKGLVFPPKRSDGERRDVNLFLKQLNPIVKKMPIFTDGTTARQPGRKYHLFRHDFAVRAAKAGVPIPELKNWLGHSSITTTMIYAQYSPDQYSAYIERI